MKYTILQKHYIVMHPRCANIRSENYFMLRQ